MKKLLVLALMALSVAVFAADENTSSDSATTTTSVGGVAPAAAPVSVGESFMGAFGMSSSPAGTSSSNSVGSVSSGMSSIGSNTVNNVTTTTPYSYK